MALIVGLLLIILGSVALCVWVAEVVVFLKGLVVFSLLFWGLMSMIVGYASYKAKRQLKAAFADGETTPSASASASLAEEVPPPTA